MNNFQSWVDRWVGLSGHSPEAVALIEERIAALRPRMIWLYLLIILYLLGVELSLRNMGMKTWNAVPMVVLLVVRLVYWVRHRRTIFLGEHARDELRRVAFGALAIGVGYLILLAVGATQTDAVTWQMLLLSGAVCAIAAAQTLSVFPASGRIILLVLGLPTSLMAMFCSANIIAGVVGFNLALCSGVSLYLLNLQDHSFRRHIVLRHRSDADTKRAERAEQVALNERRLAKAAADTDFLTGLPNRRAFLTAVERRDCTAGDDTVLILDLDGFKPVNDTLGHAAGDELLKQVGNRLLSLVTPNMFVARLGGDEFALLLSGISGKGALAFADNIVAVLGEPYNIGSSTVGVASCCGVATLASDCDDPTQAMREADLALYRAKSKGRGIVEQYDNRLGEEVRRRSQIERALRNPGVEEDIDLVFQPIFTLRTMRIEAFEALARWSHPTLGELSPSDFIPITEQMQLVERLTENLLVRALVHARRWRGRQRLSFNLSAVQLCSPGGATRVLDVVTASDFNPSRLQIEVTETAMMNDIEAARRNLSLLREAGVKVVLDDFGAGYASIGYLREMQFDELKIDGSLVEASGTPHGAALLRGVIDLARALGTPCVAEHVESIDQVNLLRKLGCDYGQGFWLGRPETGAIAEALSRLSLEPSRNWRRAG